MLRFIKKLKWVLVILLIGLFILFIYIYIKSLQGDTGGGPTVYATPTPKVTPRNPPFSTSSLLVVVTSPNEGIFETANMYFPISFKFSQPIDIATLNMTTSPKIDVRTKVFDSTPDTLWVSPTVPWKSGVEYTITIAGLNSIDKTEVLNNPVKYVITFKQVDFIEGGDPAPLE